MAYFVGYSGQVPKKNRVVIKIAICGLSEYINVTFFNEIEIQGLLIEVIFGDRALLVKVMSYCGLDNTSLLERWPKSMTPP